MIDSAAAYAAALFQYRSRIMVGPQSANDDIDMRTL